MSDDQDKMTDILNLLKAEDLDSAWCGPGGLFDRAATEIERLRTERDKFEWAWREVSEKYEALLNQVGATDA